MNTITDAYKKVPLMFQAQTKGRSQLNYLDKNKSKQDVEIWTEEWTEKCEDTVPDFPETVQKKEYQLSWRFVTNGGQDDGIIRPVMGVKGIPYYPGSSMKGAFRKACREIEPNKVSDYCGDEDNPGILRFHGGYPTDNSWQQNLVDLVHPQQGWQVKTKETNRKPGGESAFALISLYQPELRFGISSNRTLDDPEWDTIWQIWERAISSGLGCRVSAGYGQPNEQQEGVLYRAYLEGQGIASTVIGNESGEFRPNIFKASIRGHALRIFGGLTDAKTAESLVETIFGGVSGKGTVGLLAMNWKNSIEPIIGEFDEGYGEATFKVRGILRWLVTQPIPNAKKASLTKLIKVLMRFSLLVGGFGKSWRRVDHRLFYEEYYGGNKTKPLIGCHWQWRDKSLDIYNCFDSPGKVTGFLKQVQTVAREWMKSAGITPNPSKYADWRESWHKNKVQVWGRIAQDKEDSEAIPWFHKPYRPAIREINRREASIYRSDLTGEVSKISRIWHRMYPISKKMQNRQTGDIKYLYPKNQQYLELLTIFPDDSDLCSDFIDYLGSSSSNFAKLW